MQECENCYHIKITAKILNSNYNIINLLLLMGGVYVKHKLNRCYYFSIILFQTYLNCTG